VVVGVKEFAMKADNVLLSVAPAKLLGDGVEILLRHDHWALSELLEACAGLTAAQFHQRFEMGLGSLHANMVHSIGAKLRWADRVSERAISASIEMVWPGDLLTDAGGLDAVHPPVMGAGGKPEYTVGQLAILLEVAHARIMAAYHEAGAAGTMATVLPIVLANGTTYYVSPAGALVHVATHGVHHRAQSINMLRQIYKAMGPGGPALPHSSVMEWQSFGEPVA